MWRSHLQDSEFHLNATKVRSLLQCGGCVNGNTSAFFDTVLVTGYAWDDMQKCFWPGQVPLLSRRKCFFVSLLSLCFSVLSQWTPPIGCAFSKSGRNRWPADDDAASLAEAFASGDFKHQWCSHSADQGGDSTHVNKSPLACIHASAAFHSVCSYPDTRQQYFGMIDGRMLNFTKADDRLTAVTWYAHRTILSCRNVTAALAPMLKRT